MRARQGNQAFTILELLAVMAIIGVLAAALIVMTQGLFPRVDRENSQTLILRVLDALERYHTDFLRYPPADGTSRNLSAYLANPVLAPDGILRGPYLDEGDLRGVAELYRAAPFDEANRGFAIEEAMWDGATLEKRVVFRIVDRYGHELRYENGGRDWAAADPKWKDTRGTFDLICIGPNGQMFTPGAAADNDDIANYNIR